MGNVKCTGSENSLSSCDYDNLTPGQCTTGKIATAYCVEGKY